jgi:hypothetical protein
MEAAEAPRGLDDGHRHDASREDTQNRTEGEPRGDAWRPANASPIAPHCAMRKETGRIACASMSVDEAR